MSLVRAIARPLLASQFIYGGIQAFKGAQARVGPAERFAEVANKIAPQLPTDPVLLVRANAATHVVGGLMLATGRFTRLSSAVLAASLIPTTVFGHPFWDEDDPTKRGQQKIHFFKNLSMLGGLMLASVDTEGQPGLAWRARHAVDQASTSTDRLVHDVSQRAQLLTAKAKLRAHELGS